MRFFVGTSGYGFKEWKGSFYPEKLSQKQLLNYYSQRLSTVEINYTFRRKPTVSLLESWARQVPATFRFGLKASQSITHAKRLKNAEEATDYLIETASVLKERLGPLLFQLPPNFKKDLPRLDAFLDFVGNRARLAFEFRHESWYCDEVFDCLRRHSVALCVADVDEFPNADVISTAGWGYVRLRRERYTNKKLSEWIDRLRSQNWDEAYVFFKHEDTGTGPKLAARFLKLAGA